MKGAGDTISRIVMIVTVVLIFSFLVASAFSNSLKTQRIVLEETELFNVKNTFFLANKSLAETWRLSTIQSVFYTGDTSIECGFDPAGRNLLIGEKYWLRTPIANAKTNKAGAMLVPEDGQKYNKETTPMICGPDRNHLEEVLNKKMAEFSKGASIKANNLDVDVRDVRSSVKAEDEKIVSTTSYALEVSSGGCANSISCASTITKNVSSIDVELGRMVDVARQIVYQGAAPVTVDIPVGSLLDYSTAFIQFLVDPATKEELSNIGYIYSLKFQDIFATETFSLPVTNSWPEYIDKQRTIISTIAMWRNLFSFRGTYLKNSDIIVSFSKQELISPPQGAGMMLRGTGLIFHYDITITIRDKGQYYFHNVNENKFEKRQPELQLKAEDYVPAIDCTEKGVLEAIQMRNNNNKLQRIFNWEPSKRQLMCFQGILYSCGDLQIPNLPRQNIIGVGNNMPDGFWKCTAGGITT